jgi:predicted nucleic acid-binding protein
VRSLVDEYFQNIALSTQVLGEFFHVLTKKGLQKKEDARLITVDLIANFSVFEVLLSSVTKAMDISIRDGYSYWDSLVLAVALENNCSILYSEDMQDGQFIEGKLRLQNPFVAKKRG